MNNPAQVMPSSQKTGGGFGGIDAQAIERAEAALKAMSAQFGQWLQDEIAKLEAAQTDLKTLGYTPETTETLYFRAHDLKGLGATYQYPVVSRLAASLCRLIDSPERRLTAPQTLVEAHIDAIRAVVRDQIQTDEHPTGKALAETLEARVAEHQR